MKVFSVEWKKDRLSVSEGYVLGHKPEIDLGDGKVVRVLSSNGRKRLSFACLLQNIIAEDDYVLDFTDEATSSRIDDINVLNVPLGIFVVDYQIENPKNKVGIVHGGAEAAKEVCPFSHVRQGTKKAFIIVPYSVPVGIGYGRLYMASITVHSREYYLSVNEAGEFEFQDMFS